MVNFAELMDVMDLRVLGPRSFEGRTPAGRTRPVFGGQFLAQALLAAGRTVETGRSPHSLHAYFLRPGDQDVPIRYDVEAIRDGRGFSHRAVIASQGGKEVFRQIQSFAAPRDAPDYQVPAPVDDVDPTTFPSYLQWCADSSDNPGHDATSEPQPVEIHFEDAPPPKPGSIVTGPIRLWMRLSERVPSEDPVLHAALLAWLSDKSIGDLTVLVLGHCWTDLGANTSSLDHAMWFHRPARADQWLLFTQECPTAAGLRGLARGDFFTNDGRLVASAAQEALITLPDH